MNWLVVLPFELTTAGITIGFWTQKVDPVTGDVGAASINVGVWITIFLLSVVVVNIFGVRGYGEVEFVLGCIKVAAIIGFILLGVIIDCGGVPTDTRGYIGAHYWHEPGAFRNGFKGFCSVFVTASFAFGGTELVGLAAVSLEPKKDNPQGHQAGLLAYLFVLRHLAVPPWPYRPCPITPTSARHLVAPPVILPSFCRSSLPASKLSLPSLMRLSPSVYCPLRIHVHSQQLLEQFRLFAPKEWVQAGQRRPQEGSSMGRSHRGSCLRPPRLRQRDA